MKHPQAPIFANGFTLLEALVAMLIISFGMLGVVKLQSVISHNADVAKQRSEAVRLAQEKMECLRSFSQIASAAATTSNCNGELKVLAWNDLATTADPGNPLTSAYSNGRYTRNWTVAGANTDPLRALSVTVQWTDRAEQPQAVTLNSLLAKSDPAQQGMLGFPLPANTNLKRPKDRNLNIPVPASALGDGKSAYQVSPTLAVVFSNDSGYVIQKCSSVVTPANYANNTAGCTNYSAYIVAGYVSGESDSALDLVTGINTGSVSGANTASGPISCAYGAATDQSTGVVITGFKYYLCVIPVVEGAGWAGTIRLSGLWPVASNNSSRWLACRFQYATGPTLNENQRNVQPYVNVKESLDNQNYYIASNNSGTCPTLTNTAGNGPSAQSLSVTTTLHQDCRLTTGNTTNCPVTFTPP